MKLADRFRLAYRAFQFQTIGDLDRLMDAAYFGRPTASGTSVSEASAQRQATVFSCIDIKSRDGAALPVKLIEKTDGGGRRELANHPVARWLRRPNAAMNWYSFRRQGWINLNVWGNEFSQIRRNDLGEIETWPLDPDPQRMKVIQSGGEKRYEYRLKDGSKRVFGPDEVLHNFGYSVNGIWGLSPIQMCMETHGHAEALEKYGAMYFDDPVPRVTFERDADFRDETAIDSFLKRWKEKFSPFSGGGERAAVLPKGMKANILKIPNNEAQFIEARKFSKEELAQIYHVPLHRLMALDRATFSNIEHQAIEYVVYGLMPDLVGFEQAAGFAFLTDDERQSMAIKHNVDGLLRGDYKTRMEGNKLAIESSQMTPNEARALEEREALEGGDGLRGPLNFGPINAEPIPPEPAPRSMRSVPKVEQRAKAEGRRKLAQSFQAPIEKQARKTLGPRIEEIRAKVDELLRGGSTDQFLEWLNQWSVEQVEKVAGEFLPVFSALAELAARQAADDIDVDEVPELDKFTRAYAERLARSIDEGTRAQIADVIANAEDGSEADDVDERLGQWEEGGPSGTTRAEKIARRESNQIVNAVAAVVFGLAGLSMVWVTFGKNCPYCNELNGRRVASGEFFVPKGGQVPGEDGQTMKSRGIRHPPLHGGCDCGVAPG